MRHESGIWNGLWSGQTSLSRVYIHEIWSQSWRFSWYNLVVMYSEQMGMQSPSMYTAQKGCPVLVRS